MGRPRPGRKTPSGYVKNKTNDFRDARRGLGWAGGVCQLGRPRMRQGGLGGKEGTGRGNGDVTKVTQMVATLVGVLISVCKVIR